MLTRVLAAARGLLYASVFVFFWWWVVVLARPLDDRLPLTLPSTAWWPGFVTCALGALLALWCVVSFALVGHGTPALFDAPRKFVAVGPYRYVRNPMYIGAILVIFGSGLMIRSPAALIVGIVFFLLAHLLVVFYEEPDLERRFGETYRSYCREVRRWIPSRPASSARHPES